MKAFGYARVSTEKQDISVFAQQEKIESYCKLNDLHLVEVFLEKESARTMAQRPVFQGMIERLLRKEAGALVVAKLDRFARNTTEALTLSKKLDRKGIAIHSIAEKVDTKSAMGQFFFTIMAAMAEFDLNRGGERTRDVLQHKKSQGEKTGGAVPFGFDSTTVIRPSTGENDLKILIPNPREQEVLAIIRVMRAENASWYSIALYLNKMGYATKQGGSWQAVQVQRAVEFSGGVHAV